MADPASCATCRHWHEGAPPLSAASLNPQAKANVGTCQLYAPVLTESRWFLVSMFPETHADRSCGDWEERPDPDDGERADIDTVVVPIRSEAA